MAFDFSVALTWILFLAVFPLGFFWLRRAWRILFKGDFSEVALRRGEPPAVPSRWAPWAGVLNLTAGGMAVVVVLMVLVWQVEYSTWSAVAGSTIWCKLMLDFALARQAHGKARGKAAAKPGA